MQAKIDEAVETLEQALNSEEQHGMMFTGGKDSMIMLKLWRDHLTDQPPLLVVDTHNQFDEVYDFRKEIADKWNLELDVRANEEFLEDVIWNEDDERDFAWDGFKTDGCCGALKIDVIGDFISSGYEALIVGRRGADVGRELSTVEDTRDPLPHDRYYPLANWSDAHINAYINKNDLPLPELYAEGYEHTDCVTCTEMGDDGDEWSGVSQEKREQLRNLRDMGYM